MKHLIYLLFLLPTVLFSQHKIEGVFTPAEEYTYAFLYYATPSGASYIDRAEVDAGGHFSITLDSTAPQGIYKIVYALPPEDNNFDLIYNGKENVAITYSTEKGLDFTASSENKLWSSYTKSMELVNMTISNYYTKKSTDKKAFKDIFKTLSDTQSAFEEASKGKLAHVFITANSPYIPTDFEDISTYSNHLKDTYLKYVDFNNPLLQSSDFLIDRVLAYVFGMSQNTDNATYTEHIDNLVTSIGDNDDTLGIKISLLQLIWQRFADNENTTLANYISDTYLIPLAKQTKNKDLETVLVAYKNNTIGMKAQNFELVITKNGATETTTLHDLTGDNNYLLIFWSSTCGHCLQELPEVTKIVPQNTRVIAIGLEDDGENWEKAIRSYPNFTHILALGKWDNPISIKYNISATPTYFILDKDKNIIAKPYDITALKEILN